MRLSINIKSIIIITVLIFTIISLCPGRQFTRDDNGYRTKVTNEIETNSRGSLELSSIAGDVRLDSWDENKVKIVEDILIEVYTEAEAKEILEKYTLEIKKSGDVIVAHGPKRFRNYVEISYLVTLPRKFEAEIHTSGGDFTIMDILGKYRFKTSGGDIDLIRVEGDIECSTSGGDLNIRSVKGHLEASTSGGDINCYDSSDNLKLSTSGGDIELKSLSGEVVASTSGGDIEVVKLTGNCDLRTSGGDVDLREITSTRTIEAYTSGGDIEGWHIEGNIKAKTSGGDIVFSNIKGKLSSSTSGGDIELDNISDDVDVSTSGGDIVLKNLDSSVKASTSGGDIEITTMTGFVEAATSGGDVKVEINKFISGKDQHIKMSSSGGDLTLELPFDFKGTVEAVIEVKGADIEDYNIDSDFPLKIAIEADEGSSEKKRKFLNWNTGGIITGSGEINGGGNTIVLETVNGDIYIEKK